MNRMREFLRFLLANALPPALFASDIDLGTARTLFARWVKLVEIENHSYCNRVCWFCPNSFVDRRSEASPISPELYRKLLDNLAEIGYSQTLVWARYHEPMAHDSIYTNLALARAALPRAFLTIHTNGDYLSRDTVRLLEATGIDQVRVNLYVANGQPYTPDAVAKLSEQLQRRTSLQLVPAETPGQSELKGSNIHIPVFAPNFNLGMASRGGSLATISGLNAYQRTSACFSPIQHVVVDFNGKGMLCCQVRSDVPEHNTAVMGDLSLNDYTLFHYYRDLAPARKALLMAGKKEGVCRTCTANQGGPSNWGRSPLLANSLNLVGAGKLTQVAWQRRARRYDSGAN